MLWDDIVPLGVKGLNHSRFLNLNCKVLKRGY